MQIKTPSKLLLSTALLTALSACSTDNILTSKVDYRSGSDNVSRNPLEVPPDLSQVATPNATANTTLSATTAAQANNTNRELLPKPANARIVNQDGLRFIEATLSANEAWERSREFWLANGFTLTTEKPATGVMETDWLENRADLPNDFMTNLVRKFADYFVSTGRLDKYRTRIERGNDDQHVNIYLTYRGMTEVYKEGSAQTQNWGGTAYTAAPPNPELELEMMGLLMQSFGLSKEESAQAVQQASAKPVARASLDNNSLLISDGFDRAWRRVGLAFDRVGYNIQDRNRSAGLFTVQRAATDIDKEVESSYFSSLAFWKKDESGKVDGKGSNAQTFEVKLSPQGDKTRLTITSKDPIEPAVQKKMLNDLLNQLK
ncbi:outer membrane protein assembly factor BamC [Chitinibacter sp. ZOR0017]|uniref:outer membrane protein assembly factor BamC n=1 Tax=Chitinibacter sp. ZOR0017 TaxID=1339254 RepID=UPI00064770E9|nr:outer membrane protein assembly factor BamC [Chitinibacter sp. ZOR0017]